VLNPAAAVTEIELPGDDAMIRICVAARKWGAVALIAWAGWQLGFAATASAQQPPLPVAETAPPAAEAPAGPTALTTPSMSGPLVANPNPLVAIDEDPFGKIYVGGAITGLGLFQTNPFAGDRSDHGDASNAQIFFQKTDGLFQFLAQIGAYSFPALGSPYINAGRTVGDFFGPVPVAYGKLAPTDTISIQGGKLPTLIGAEYAFTFQNMNIERGLLWNQEPVVSRGVQGNYTLGPLAFSLSLNDGFYSGRYSWISGSAAWTVDKENTLSVTAGGNVGTTPKSTLATPFFQDNSEIVDVIYTYSSAPWTVTPYFQFTNVPSSAKLGIGHDASTYGGAMLASYQFNENVSLAGRAEYIASTGSVANGSPSLLYGPGSSAFSFTLTPTYQEGIFFIRDELSYVLANGITPGFGFGHGGRTHNQARIVLEAGLIF
jgi:Putative beta-barrel porin-2, OmpL-like. bbp2